MGPLWPGLPTCVMTYKIISYNSAVHLIIGLSGLHGVESTRCLTRLEFVNLIHFVTLRFYLPPPLSTSLDLLI